MNHRSIPLTVIAVLFLSQLALAQDTPPNMPADLAPTTQATTRPADAIVLFDGTEESEQQWIFRDRARGPAKWPVANGEMASNQHDIFTKQKFQNFTLHVEWNEPVLPASVKGQERGNSGVYLQGRYEIQVLDSYGLDSKKDDCGAVYGQKAPLVNACLPPGQWQTYDITFTAAKYDADGKKTANARVTVFQNGKKIQDDVEITGCTGSELLKEGPTPGPIMLQYHSGHVRFRNVWIVPAP